MAKLDRLARSMVHFWGIWQQLEAYKLTVRGSAKVELDGVLSSITGHRQEGSVATWVLTQEEVQSLINALQIIRGVQQVGVSSS